MNKIVNAKNSPIKKGGLLENNKYKNVSQNIKINKSTIRYQPQITSAKINK